MVDIYLGYLFTLNFTAGIYGIIKLWLSLNSPVSILENLLP